MTVGILPDEHTWLVTGKSQRSEAFPQDPGCSLGGYSTLALVAAIPNDWFD
jgi:hypothetical protein